jgi:hypothetical protein
MGKGSEVKTFRYKFRAEKQYEKFMSVNNAALVRSGSDKVVLTVEDLHNDGVYTFVGPFYEAVMPDQVRRKVDEKVLEVEAAQAVKNFLGRDAQRGV